MEIAALSLYTPDVSIHPSIQACVNAAALNPRGAVWISAGYKGTDGFTNVNNVPIFDLRGSGSLSFASGGASLGSPNTWTALQTFTRTAETGTALGTGNFTILGWGSGAAISSVAGYDGLHTLTITAGTSPSASPTIQLTFADGAWSKSPIVVPVWAGGTGQASDLAIVSTTTIYTITYNGLPVNTKTYVFNVMVRGLT